MQRVESIADSYGTDFITIFPWNNGNAESNPQFALDIINPNIVATAVTIFYGEVKIESMKREILRKQIEIIVNATSTFNVILIYFVFF